jgi:hypothetical protein
MTEAINQNQQTVAKIHYTILIYKQGKFPEDKNTSFNYQSLNQPKFYAYHPHDHGLMEQFGLYYEDLEVGEIYEHRPGKTFFEAQANQALAETHLDIQAGAAPEENALPLIPAKPSRRISLLSPRLHLKNLRLYFGLPSTMADTSWGTLKQQTRNSAITLLLSNIVCRVRQ